MLTIGATEEGSAGLAALFAGLRPVILLGTLKHSCSSAVQHCQRGRKPGFGDGQLSGWGVKSEVKLRVVPKMQSSVKQQCMWRLEQKGLFRLIGKSIRVSRRNGNHYTKIPGFWNGCQKDGFFSLLTSMDTGAPDLEHYRKEGFVEVWIAVKEK